MIFGYKHCCRNVKRYLDIIVVAMTLNAIWALALRDGVERERRAGTAYGRRSAARIDELAGACVGLDKQLRYAILLCNVMAKEATHMKLAIAEAPCKV